MLIHDYLDQQKLCPFLCTAFLSNFEFHPLPKIQEIYFVNEMFL